MSDTKYVKVVEKDGICPHCNHPFEKHVFDMYPVKNLLKPCELSCTICFQEETDRLRGEKLNA